MQQGYFFQDDTGDRVYSAEDWSYVWRRLGRNGVTPGDGGGCQVMEDSPIGMRVRVSIGSVWVEGRLLDVYQAETLVIEGNGSGNPRIDRVIVKLDVPNRSLGLEVLKGTAAASPIPPLLTRTASIYELSLAQIGVNSGTLSITNSMITDERLDSNVCGYAIHPALSRSSGEWVEVDSYVDDNLGAAFSYTYTLPAEDAACFDEYRVVGYIKSDAGASENDIGVQINGSAVSANYSTVVYDNTGIDTYTTTPYVLVAELMGTSAGVGQFETWITGRHKYGSAFPRISNVSSGGTTTEEKGLDGQFLVSVDKITSFRVMTELAARGAIRVFGRNLWNSVYPD